jgi:hypothetical protein
MIQGFTNTFVIWTCLVKHNLVINIKIILIHTLAIVFSKFILLISIYNLF